MSEDKDTKKEMDENSAGENVENTQEEVKQETKEPTMEEQYLDAKDRYLRLYAEFENFRKRTNKEKLDIISTANAGVIKDLLPVIDDFERAMENNANADDINAVKEGFNLIYSKLNHILTAKGLKVMDVVDQPFDSELHEAIANIPAPSADMKGKVIEAIEKGYYLNEKVIRYAKVVVGQ